MFSRAFKLPPGTSRSPVRHSYTRTRNVWKFCTPVATIRSTVQFILYPLGTSVSSVRLSHNIRNFWKICKNLIPLLGNAVTPVRLWHNTRGTGIPSLQYPGTSVNFQVSSEMLIIDAVMFFQSYINRTPNTASSTYQGCVRCGTYRGVRAVFIVGITGTGHGGKCGTTSIPVPPETSVSSVRRQCR